MLVIDLQVSLFALFFVFIEIGIIIESFIYNRVIRACKDMPSAIVSVNIS